MYKWSRDERSLSFRFCLLPFGFCFYAFVSLNTISLKIAENRVQLEKKVLSIQSPSPRRASRCPLLAGPRAVRGCCESVLDGCRSSRPKRRAQREGAKSRVRERGLFGRQAFRVLFDLLFLSVCDKIMFYFLFHFFSSSILLVINFLSTL